MSPEDKSDNQNKVEETSAPAEEVAEEQVEETSAPAEEVAEEQVEEEKRNATNNYLLAYKVGMTQIFSPDGGTIGVSVLRAGPCTIVQKKTVEKEGYDSLQLGFIPTKEKGLTKAELSHFSSRGIQPFRYLKEVPSPSDKEDLSEGEILDVTVFDRGSFVDISGISKGKGFAGGMKRHGFGGGPATHGGMFDRGLGSVGQAAWPSKIFKGKKMPGQMGNKKNTVEGLLVVDIIPEKNVLIVRGSVPGGTNSLLIVRDSLKGKKKDSGVKEEIKKSLNPLKASKRMARGG